MPAILDRRPPSDDGDRDPKRIQFGAILEKIRRGGSGCLTDAERVAVVEIFRCATLTRDKRVVKLRDEISAAHLEYCFRLPPKNRCA
jgi:hypothetical protein